MKKVYFSCVVDTQPLFLYQSWYLVWSLIEYAGIPPEQIFVHYVPNVDLGYLDKIDKLGVRIVPISPFGDGKFCNKIVQMDTVALAEADVVCFMDADMLVLEDFRHIVSTKMILGKIVDYANPSLDTLIHVFQQAGFLDFPAIFDVDLKPELKTFSANFNGGLYIVPTQYLSKMSVSWKKWACWLLEYQHIFKDDKVKAHVDQIAFCLAVHELRIPVDSISRKYNFPTHTDFPKNEFPINLHYHRSITITGLLDVIGNAGPEFLRAITKANALIQLKFDNKIFWPYRYQMYPERGSGIGSRGACLEYKRNLLQSLDIEKSPGVLDVGCGDLEVLKSLFLKGYVGVDKAQNAIEIAQSKRPDWQFILHHDNALIPEKDSVLCFEVLIHQTARKDYDDLINLLTAKTKHRLIVSGYSKEPIYTSTNHMIYFYEPLEESLRKTGQFSSIQKIGSHTDVDIYIAEKLNDSPLNTNKNTCYLPCNQSIHNIKTYIHIGTPKTGTTALQYYLSKNRDLLLQYGADYPAIYLNNTGDRKHAVLFNYVLNCDVKNIDPLIDYVRLMVSSGVSKFILSSEGFYNHLYDFNDESLELLAELNKILNIYLVVFLRPQCHFLESLYRQYVRNPPSKLVEEYATSLSIDVFSKTPRIKASLDYAGSLNKLASYLGDEAIIVNTYSKNVISDFLNIIGLPVKADGIDGITKKRSLSRRVTELLRQINPIINSDSRQYVIEAVEQFDEAIFNDCRDNFLSSAAMCNIMDEHYEGNNYIARKWLNRVELFPGYNYAINTSWSPEVLSNYQAVELLLRTLEYSLTKSSSDTST